MQACVRLKSQIQLWILLSVILWNVSSIDEITCSKVSRDEKHALIGG